VKAEITARFISHSRTPFCEAGRALLAAGCDDPSTSIVMRHAGGDADSVRSTVGAAARLTMEESPHGPIFRRYRSTPQSTPRAAHASN
jgi:hypothetical protein